MNDNMRLLRGLSEGSKDKIIDLLLSLLEQQENQHISTQPPDRQATACLKEKE